MIKVSHAEFKGDSLKWIKNRAQEVAFLPVCSNCGGLRAWVLVQGPGLRFGV